MKFVSTALSDVGRLKKVNEDACLLQIEETIYGQACLALVCDGVGSLQYGDRAGNYVVNRMSRWFEMLSKIKFDLSDNIIQQVNDEIKAINQELIRIGNEAETKLGTTLSAILLVAGEYYLFHVGDTRIYQFTERLRCLTYDHTVAAAKLRNGQMTEEEAESSNEKHVLLQCIGASPILEIQNASGSVGKKEVFLLCSDGFYNKLNIGEVEDVMEEMKYMEQSQLKQIAETLVVEVMERGEKDNISAIFLKVE